MLKLKLQYFGHLIRSWLTWKDPDAGRDWRKEEKGTTDDETVGRRHWLDGHEFEQTPGAGDRQGGLACCSPWVRKELNTTEWLNWTENFQMYKLGLEKAEEPEIKLLTVTGLQRTQGNSRKAHTSAPSLTMLDYMKAYNCVENNKMWKILQEMGISDHLTCFPEKPLCRPRNIR